MKCFKQPHRSALLLMLCLSFLDPPIAAAQSGGGGYTLAWSGASGGAGASSGGSFSVSGTAGQPQTEQLQGGSYSLTGGFEQPVCPSGAAQVVPVMAARSDTNITLTWTNRPANGAYEVHRDATPYFMPGLATLLNTVFAPVSSYTDQGAAGIPGQSLFYVVRAKCGALWGDSGRTGGLSYLLVPGS